MTEKLCEELSGGFFGLVGQRFQGLRKQAKGSRIKEQGKDGLGPGSGPGLGVSFPVPEKGSRSKGSADLGPGSGAGIRAHNGSRLGGRDDAGRQFQVPARGPG